MASSSKKNKAREKSKIAIDVGERRHRIPLKYYL